MIWDSSSIFFDQDLKWSPEYDWSGVDLLIKRWRIDQQIMNWSADEKFISRWRIDQQMINWSADDELISRWWIDQQMTNWSADDDLISRWRIDQQSEVWWLSWWTAWETTLLTWSSSNALKNNKVFRISHSNTFVIHITHIF